MSKRLCRFNKLLINIKKITYIVQPCFYLFNIDYTLYNEICKCEDLDYLAECLSSDLAQNEKTSKLVRSEAFWRRAFEDRWPHLNKKKAKSKTWLQVKLNSNNSHMFKSTFVDNSRKYLILKLI